jgi:predicted nuclease of restriction endonuclease-like RecB superfamily
MNKCSRPKIKKFRGHKVGTPAWNKGLTKETSESVKQYSESLSKTWQKQIQEGSYVPRKMGNKARLELSELQSLHNRGGKSKWYEIDGQKVQGTYEKQFAEQLVKEGIDWEKIKTNNHLFKYKVDGKIKSYAPDFYIPSMNLYVEIKGFWWGDDETKMKTIRDQCKDKKVIVIFGKEKLDSICKSIKELLPLEPVWLW